MSKCRNGIGLIFRIAITLLLLLICVFLVYYVTSGLYYNYINNWSSYYTNAAYEVYKNGAELESLPEHSVNGFPLHLYFWTLVVALNIFVLIRLVLKRTTKIAVICTCIISFYLMALISLSIVDYYNSDYKTNVMDAYMFNYNRWWQEDENNAVQMVEDGGKLFVVDTE